MLFLKIFKYCNDHFICLAANVSEGDNKSDIVKQQPLRTRHALARFE